MNGETLGKGLVVAGLGLAVVGVLVWAIAAWLPGFRPGRLPGDIVVERPGFVFAFPLATMILASLALTFILWIAGMVRR